MGKFQKAQPPSPARVRLRELIAAKREATEALDAAQARVGALARLARVQDDVRAKLKALDAQEGQAFALWSLTPDAPSPVADTATRRAIEAELADAMAQAGAADRAIAGVQAEAEKARNVTNAVERELILATGIAALEEFSDLETEAKRAMAALADVQSRADVLRHRLSLMQIHSDGSEPNHHQFAVAFGESMTRMARAFDAPPRDMAAEAEYVAKVTATLAELRSDAGARIPD